MRKEPVLIGGIINVAVAVVSAIGLDITTEQLAAVVSVTTAIISFFQRSKVSPDN